MVSSAFLVPSVTPSTVDLPTNNEQVEGMDAVEGVAGEWGQGPAGRQLVNSGVENEKVKIVFTVRKLSNFKYL